MRAGILDYLSVSDLFQNKVHSDPHPSSKPSVSAAFESTFPQGKAFGYEPIMYLLSINAERQKPLRVFLFIVRGPWRAYGAYRSPRWRRPAW